MRMRRTLTIRINTDTDSATAPCNAAKISAGLRILRTAIIIVGRRTAQSTCPSYLRGAGGYMDLRVPTGVVCRLMHIQHPQAIRTRTVASLE